MSAIHFFPSSVSNMSGLEMYHQIAVSTKKSLALGIFCRMSAFQTWYCTDSRNSHVRPSLTRHSSWRVAMTPGSAASIFFYLYLIEEVKEEGCPSRSEPC
jgi:hypothetical protein